MTTQQTFPHNSKIYPGLWISKESEQEQGGEKLQEALVAYSLIFYMKPPYTMYNVNAHIHDRV